MPMLIPKAYPLSPKTETNKKETRKQMSLPI